MKLPNGLDCGCGPGNLCGIQGPEALMAFNDAVRALVKARMKTLGKCQQCTQRGAVTAVPVEYLHLDWRRKHREKTWLSLCGQCWKAARKAIPKPDPSDKEELF